MNNETLYRAIGDTDDMLLERCEGRPSARRAQPAWIKWGAAAACLCLVLAGAFSFGRSGPATRPGTGSVISSYEGGQSGVIYAAPGNGEVLLFPEVSAALDANAGDEYFVAVDVYRDGVLLEPGSGELQAELKRLAEGGYRVGYATGWTYQGEDMEQADVVYLAGYFTAGQLRGFTADGYGYTFSFAVNGDGSAVSPNQKLTAELPQ